MDKIEKLGADAADAAEGGARALVLGNLLALLLILALCVLLLWVSHAIFEQRALDAADSLVRSVDQSVTAEIDGVDRTLQTVVLAFERAAGSTRLDSPAFVELVSQQRGLATEIQSLYLVDAQGRISSGVDPAAGVDVSGDAFFVQARSARSRKLIVSAPIFVPQTGKWVIVLARQLGRPDGALAGLVCASFAVEHFTALFASLDTGPDAALMLRTSDLKMVARHRTIRGGTFAVGSTAISPQLRSALQAAPAGGRYLAHSPFDGVERATAYRRLDRYPLMVLVGLSLDAYLVPWRQAALLVVGLALLLVLVLLGSSVLVLRVWRRESVGRRALHREALRNRALLLTASDGIHVLDREGRLVELSDSFATLLGCTRTQLRGRHCSTWDGALPGVALNERVEWSGQYRHSDGRPIDVEVVCVGVRIDSQELLYCSARDVTERKSAERALRANEAFSDRTGRIASVGGWEYDLISGVITWSDQTCRIHGVPLGYRPTVEESMQFYGPEVKLQLEAVVERAIREGTPWDIELPLHTVGGRSIWARAFGEAQYENGQPVRLIGAVQDITERKLGQAELQREQAVRAQLEGHARELAHLLQERGAMLDVLAHEVRQPLNNASAALQSAATALAGMGEQIVSQRLKRAQTVMGQVVASIDNTLAVAALLAGREPIARVDSDIDVLVAVAIADMPDSERSRVRIDRVTQTRTASMDLGLMRLALRNVLSNALRYSPSGTPVRLRLSDSDEPLALLIDVIDEGPGIDAELLPNLFERGARGNRAGAPAGLGLGLYIVNRVMALHGGRVELVANAGTGLTMRLLLVQPPTD